MISLNKKSKKLLLLQRNELLTKNQIYIYFLIPLLCAYFHADILQEKFNTKDKFIYLIIMICLEYKKSSQKYTIFRRKL